MARLTLRRNRKSAPFLPYQRKDIWRYDVWIRILDVRQRFCASVDRVEAFGLSCFVYYIEAAV